LKEQHEKAYQKALSYIAKETQGASSNGLLINALIANEKLYNERLETGKADDI